MICLKQQKELTIVSLDKTTSVAAKVVLPVSTADAKIFQAYGPLATLVEGATRCDIGYVYQGVTKVDDSTGGGGSTEPPTPPPTGNDTEFTLPAYQFTYTVALTDQDVYGENLDGKNRKVILIWKDTNGAEYQVPLTGFDDTTNPKNPNKEFEYNSETQQISFKLKVMDPVKYILRRLS